jgi:hypothetical protein
MPSSSRIKVSVSAQISSNRCQSVELRASRESSKPSTIPARPIHVGLALAVGGDLERAQRLGARGGTGDA